MIKPTNLKDWDFVKNEKHDITRLLDNGLNPNDYYYQYNNGIYTPAIRVCDWEEYFN